MRQISNRVHKTISSAANPHNIRDTVGKVIRNKVYVSYSGYGRGRAQLFASVWANTSEKIFIAVRCLLNETNQRIYTKSN